MYDHILKGIDDQIAQLTAAKALLAANMVATNSPTFSMTYPEIKRKKHKRVMSVQGRANIAAGQRKRRKLAKMARKHPQQEADFPFGRQPSTVVKNGNN